MCRSLLSWSLRARSRLEGNGRAVGSSSVANRAQHHLGSSPPIYPAAVKASRLTLITWAMSSWEREAIAARQNRERAGFGRGRVAGGLGAATIEDGAQHHRAQPGYVPSGGYTMDDLTGWSVKARISGYLSRAELRVIDLSYTSPVQVRARHHPSTCSCTRRLYIQSPADPCTIHPSSSSLRLLSPSLILRMLVSSVSPLSRANATSSRLRVPPPSEDEIVRNRVILRAVKRRLREECGKGKGMGRGWARRRSSKRACGCQGEERGTR